MTNQTTPGRPADHGGSNFFYQHQIQAVAAIQPGVVLVIGGTGTGKTIFLQNLEKELKERQGLDPGSMLHIMGRARDAAVEQIKAARATTHAVVCLDDFDILLNELAGKQREDFFDDLQHIISATASQQNHIIFSSGVSKRLLSVRLGASVSYLLHSPHTEHLNPWMWAWESRLKALATDELGVSKVQADVLSTMLDDVIRITGGHPSLFFPALQFLKRLQGDPHVDLQSFPNFTEQLSSHLLHVGMPTLQQRLADLSQSAGEEGQRAYQYLISVATAGGKMPYRGGRDRVEDLSVLRLEEEALLHISSTGKEREIPGQLLVREIAARDTGPAASFILRPDTRSASPRGRLVCGGREAGKTINLTGKPWQILLYLAKLEGEVVKREKIVEEIKLESQDSFRNAYQRLDARLRKETGTRITENVRGKGYRCRVPITIEVVTSL